MSKDKMLTRESLKEQKKAMLEDVPSEKEWNEGCWEMKLINTALALYNKQAALEKRVEGLIKKLEDKVMALRTHCAIEERTPEAIQWVKGKIAGTNEVIANLESLAKEGEKWLG